MTEKQTVIVDGQEMTKEQLEEISKNPSVKVTLKEDGSYTILKRLNG